jgi:hypothetical protein
MIISSVETFPLRIPFKPGNRSVPLPTSAKGYGECSVVTQ